MQRKSGTTAEPTLVVLSDEQGNPYVASGGGSGGNSVITDPADITKQANVWDLTGSDALGVVLIDKDTGLPYNATGGSGGGTVDQGTGNGGSSPWSVEFDTPQPVTGPLTDTELRASAVPISAASLPLPLGASTAALQTQPGVDIGDVTVNNGSGAAAVNIQDGGNSITVDGPLTDTQLRNTPVPVSGTVTATIVNPLPVSSTTLATAANQTTEISSLASIKTNTDPLVVNNAGGYVRQDSTATIAKETGGNLATIKTNTDPFVATGAGGFVRQDSTATIAKETGGNLATVKTNTDPLVASGGGGYVRQDSTATIAKESGGNLATIAGIIDTKGAIAKTGSPALTFASDNGTPITTNTTTDVVAAPAAGHHLEISRLHAINTSTTAVLVSWKEASGVLLFPSFLPQYGIFSIDLKQGWHLTTATKLQLVTSASGSINWTVGYRDALD